MENPVLSANKCKLSEIGYNLYSEKKYGISFCNSGTIQKNNSVNRIKLLNIYLENIKLIEDNTFKIKDLEQH